MRSLLAVVALAALLAAGAAGWLAADRQVRVVKVEGQLAESEAAEIRRRIGQALDGGLLTMDVARLRERVMELSWPGEVSVRKVWPDTIVVRVARRTVVARWADAGYLTPGGEIVSTPNGPVDVPVFDCALSSPREVMEVYRYLQGMTSEAGLVIERITENEIGEWQLALAEPGALPAGMEHAAGPTVMLGADRLRERMGRFLVAWSRFLMDRADTVDYVDLRYGSGIAVRWREPEVQHAEVPDTAEATETT
ncbi:MAG: FtsQ-type POTRA domain-containing protein [Gammaproteobacteria bacterium]|nr:FtsQ-type POTRA domain-containing protein [Gammaproteobacteria bacterium]